MDGSEFGTAPREAMLGGGGSLGKAEGVGTGAVGEVLKIGDRGGGGGGS